MKTGAIISGCKNYRYALTRQFDGLFNYSSCIFLMLNPSTADENIDDPTIRRCINFAKSWECGGLIVGNLYALRATNPNDLWKHSDPVGNMNDTNLRLIAKNNVDIVCAWGDNAKPERANHVIEMLTANGNRLWHLGLTKSGNPRHPLYIKSDKALERWK